MEANLYRALTGLFAMMRTTPLKVSETNTGTGSAKMFSRVLLSDSAGKVGGL